MMAHCASFGILLPLVERDRRLRRRSASAAAQCVVSRTAIAHRAERATRLFYEMLITNFSKNAYVLDGIDAKAGDTQSKISGNALSPLIIHLGVAAPTDDVTARSIDGGRSVIVFLTLDFGKSPAPDAIAHTLHVLANKDEPHDIVLAPLAVAHDTPIVVAPPLRGQWIAGDSVNNLPDAAHRRAVLIDNGHAWLAQRFAIDWVQIETVNGTATTFKGPEDKNDSYFCYDQPIYSVAAGQSRRHVGWHGRERAAFRQICRRLSISTMPPAIMSWSRSRRTATCSMRICGPAPCR